MIYLACAYNHPDSRVRLARFLAANKVAAILFAKGNHVFSPISHFHPIAEAGKIELGWARWKNFDLAMIDKCDEFCVLQMDGWEESVGVQAELAYAQARKMKITFCDSEGNELL